MNYIYDISLNFSKDLYNFYEWESEDDIEFFMKIPVFKVEEEVINDFINTSFIVEKQFLNKILGKAELCGKTSLKVMKYTCIFTSQNKVIAILFNETGESIKKSFLSIDEENEVLEFAKMIKYYLINYKIKEKKDNNCFITRKEKNTKLKLSSAIKDMYVKKEFDKLKYVFYEVYDEKNENELKMYSKLINLVENNSDKITKIENVIDKIKSKEKIV